MIELAKDYCKGAKFEEGTIESLKFKNSMFDIVTCSLALDHIEDLNKAIKQINRVLKKKGLFICSLLHPLTSMFRDSEKGKFIPTHSYFDTSIMYYNIVQKGRIFPGFPRQIDTYFKVLIKNNFEIIDFIENRPKPSWNEKKSKSKSKNIAKDPLFLFLQVQKRRLDKLFKSII